MMEGKWHPECVRCQTEMESGMNARIDYENKIWIERGEFNWERGFTSERKPNGVRAALLARGHPVDLEATNCGSIHRSLKDGAAFGGETWLTRRRRRWRTTGHRGGGACARLCSALGLLRRRAAEANVSTSRTDPRRRRRRRISIRRHLATMRRAGRAAIPRVRSTGRHDVAA